MKTIQKILLGILVIALLGFGSLAIMIHRTAFVAIDERSETTTRYTIEAGMTPQNINDDLVNLGLVRNSTFANLVTRLNGWSHIQVGVYELSTALTMEEMYEKFMRGDVIESTHRVTIPEGEGLAFIAAAMAPITGLTMEDLLIQWQNTELLQALIEEYWFLTEAILEEGIKHPLEGYIYPITYEFKEEVYEVGDLTRELLDITAKQLEPVRQLMEASSMTIHETFTLASIIEGETPNNEEMPMVSGVFHNRINMEMRLQSCATVQYILEERVVHVTGEMTRIESPFNTYLNPGLPVGPVNSPSIDAIQAALEPATHDYLFFIGDIFNCVDGQTHFFNTFEEHTEFSDNYLQPSYQAGESVCQ